LRDVVSLVDECPEARIVPASLRHHLQRAHELSAAARSTLDRAASPEELQCVAVTLWCCDVVVS
jgi:hypothetical protein